MGLELSHQEHCQRRKDSDRLQPANTGAALTNNKAIIQQRENLFIFTRTKKQLVELQSQLFRSLTSGSKKPE